jgi:hypothetical protein
MFCFVCFVSQLRGTPMHARHRIHAVQCVASTLYTRLRSQLKHAAALYATQNIIVSSYARTLKLSLRAIALTPEEANGVYTHACERRDMYTNLTHLVICVALIANIVFVTQTRWSWVHVRTVLAFIVEATLEA